MSLKKNIGIVVVVIIVIVLFVIFVLPKLTEKDNKELSFTEKILLLFTKKEGFEITELPTDFFKGFSQETINLFNINLSKLLSKACNKSIKPEEMNNYYLKVYNKKNKNKDLLLDYINVIGKFFSNKTTESDLDDKEIADVIVGISLIQLLNDPFISSFITYNINTKIISFDFKELDTSYIIFFIEHLKLQKINNTNVYQTNLSTLSDTLISILKQQKKENVYNKLSEHGLEDDFDICL